MKKRASRYIEAVNRVFPWASQANLDYRSYREIGYLCFVSESNETEALSYIRYVLQYVRDHGKMPDDDLVE